MFANTNKSSLHELKFEVKSLLSLLLLDKMLYCPSSVFKTHHQSLAIVMHPAVTQWDTVNFVPFFSMDMHALQYGGTSQAEHMLQIYKRTL